MEEADEITERDPVDWWHRLRLRPSEQPHISKPKNWKRYPYPFIYGQPDPKLFPTTAWRLCSRQALGLESIKSWTEDSFDMDDPRLIEEVRTRVLPRRGIKAAAGEILITMGAQNALYLIAQLLNRSPKPGRHRGPGLCRCAEHFRHDGRPDEARSR